MSHARALAFLLAASAALAASCASVHDDEAGSPPTQAPDLTISDAARHAHFSFHEDNGAFVSAHRSFVARVDAQAAVRVMPRWEPPHERVRGKRQAIKIGEPAVTVSTLGVERGAPIALARPSVRTAADGSVSIDRGLLTERIAGDASGVEQSWSFARAPSGRGDLVVRLALDTKGSVEPIDDGVRIVDRTSSHAMRYASAAWVDARGTRTSLPVALVDGQIVLRVPGEVVDASTFPAILDPTISPEVSVDDPILDIPGFYWRGPNNVVGGKNGSFLYTWIDERVYSVDWNVYFGSQQVYGARVSAAGELLDPTGFAIAATRDFDIESDQVVFDGNNWFATWVQYPYNGPCTEMVGTRVSDTGTVLDPQNVFISCGSGGTLGFDGAQYFVLWRGSSLTTSGTYAWFAQYVTTSGQRASGAPVALIDGLAYGSIPNVLLGCDGVAQCLWVYATSGGIRGRRIAKNGVVSSEFTLTSTASDAPSTVTYDGTNFVLGYSSASAVRAMRVVPSTGAVLDAGGIAVGTTDIDGAASVNGQTLFAFTDSSKQIKGIRFSSAGAVLDASPLSLTTAASVYWSNVAGSGNQYLLAWDDTRNTNDTIYFGRVTTAGAALDGDGKNGRRAANGQRTPGVDGDATGWLVAWEDHRNQDYEPSIRAARLDAQGKSLDSGSFELAPIGCGAGVAYDGAGGYLAVYSTGSQFNVCGEIQGRLVTKATGAVGPTIPIAPFCSVMPRVIWDGTQYVVVWMDSGVKMARVSKTGTVIDSGGIAVGANTSGWGEAVGVAFDGTNYFVTWSANLTKGPGIVAARVSKTGTVIDTTPIVIDEGPYDLYGPSVAYNGQNFVIAWQDYRNAFYTNADIYWARVTTDGKVLDPQGKPLATGPGFQAYPTTLSMNDGVTTLIAWAEPRRTDRFRDFGIFGAFIRNDDGAVLDPGGIALADLPGNELFPALAPKSPGNTLLVYQRDESATGLGADRVHGRFISAGALLGQACAKNDDCTSRACADGICCDSACTDTCHTCKATPGKCTLVQGADDPDTCGGSSTCDATGACRTKTGQGCQTPADCLSGFCSGGICCDSACDGSCQTCAATPGTCTLRSARSTGAPSCAPYACDGVSGKCPVKCTSDESCPTNARCDPATGSCVEGAYCIDSKTLGGIGPIPTTCAPFTCESGACRTTCRDVHDCVFPAVCNEDGICMQASTSPVDLLEGCAMSPRRSSNATGGVLAMVALLLLRARSGRKSRERAG